MERQSDPPAAWSLRYEGGTLVLDGCAEADLPPGVEWDRRIGRGRAQAALYAPVVLAARDRGVPLEDRTRGYEKLDTLRALTSRAPREYQTEAVAAWRAARNQGVIVLPTGAGKSFVAELAILQAKRSTLVVVPTLDLLSQWYGNLRRAFGEELIGALGGGSHQIRPITVATYDSVFIHIDRYGDRFGLVIWDECHHLPAAGYAHAARSLIAPFRLGLTATPERPDGAHARYGELIGEIVFRKEIPELAGDFLAPYTTEVITVSLSDAERARHDELRARYKDFLDQNHIRIRSTEDWQRFIMLASRSQAGRAAHKAHMECKRIIQGGERKLAMVADLLAEEWGRRAIVFTNDNATAMRISRTLLIPCITHHTDVKERRHWIEAFTRGDVGALVTSRVLNEGVDIPDAEVAIVVSGSGTVRENVQRLGRILRPREGKQARLYELVTENTGETFTSERRRDHAAF
ncbi:MAG: DEAD/DEAH box helicase [Myxococcales bacterium]|nr:DEAD/DEAH box helicase [Myxococcales bacterium]